jgi:hypothetical protein
MPLRFRRNVADFLNECLPGRYISRGGPRIGLPGLQSQLHKIWPQCLNELKGVSVNVSFESVDVQMLHSMRNEPVCHSDVCRVNSGSLSSESISGNNNCECCLLTSPKTSTDVIDSSSKLFKLELQKASVIVTYMKDKACHSVVIFVVRQS